MATPAFHALRAKYGGLIRDREPDDPELVDTRQRMQEEALVMAIAKAMVKAPSMNDEVRQRIIGLLS